MIGRRSLLLAGAALPASMSAYGQCVTDMAAVDACLGGVRVTRPAGATLDLNFMSAPLETVMRVLSEAPYRVVAPLIGEIQSQCMRQQTKDEPVVK